MSLELVRCYLRDALQAYQACVAAVGISTPTLDLFALLRAARSGEVSRRGEVVTPNGLCLGYHVHGSGYSLTDMTSGRQINFDVCVIDDILCIRFTVWHLQRYASSIEQYLTRDAARDTLGEPGVIQSQLVHVNESGFDYYCYPVAVAGETANETGTQLVSRMKQGRGE